MIRRQIKRICHKIAAKPRNPQTAVIFASHAQSHTRDLVTSRWSASAASSSSTSNDLDRNARRLRDFIVVGVGVGGGCDDSDRHHHKTTQKLIRQNWTWTPARRGPASPLSTIDSSLRRSTFAALFKSHYHRNSISRRQSSLDAATEHITDRPPDWNVVECYFFT